MEEAGEPRSRRRARIDIDDSRILSGKIALVTGAGRGIGRAIAGGLAAAGARIAVADLKGAEEAAAAFDGGVGITGDVSSEKDAERIVREVVAHCGRLDILVNNAAMFATVEMKPFTEITLDEWRGVMSVNLDGVFLMTRAAVPEMRKHGGGKILNIASGTFFEGSPFFLHYVASKGGVIGMTRSLARELGSDGIQVNAIAPGFTLSEGAIELGVDEQVVQASIMARAIKREERPDDLVGAAVFLCGPGADFITGQTIAVDGGRVLQ